MDLTLRLQNIAMEQNHNFIIGNIIEAKRLLMDSTYEPHTKKAQELFQEAIESSENGAFPNIRSHIRDYMQIFSQRKPDFVQHYIQKAYEEVNDLKCVKLKKIPSLEYAKEFVDERTKNEFLLEKQVLEAKLDINAMSLEAMTPYYYDLHILNHSDDGCYFFGSIIHNVTKAELDSAKKLKWVIPENNLHSVNMIGCQKHIYGDTSLRNMTPDELISGGNK